MFHEEIKKWRDWENYSRIWGDANARRSGINLSRAPMKKVAPKAWISTGRIPIVVFRSPSIFRFSFADQCLSKMGTTALDLSSGFNSQRSCTSNGFLYPFQAIESNHENRSWLRDEASCCEHVFCPMNMSNLLELKLINNLQGKAWLFFTFMAHTLSFML